MIGALQWIVTIGRLDIHTAVMTMSGFCMAPRIGHLNGLKRIYGYLFVTMLYAPCAAALYLP
jgi:Fe2+ transport system protein B